AKREPQARQPQYAPVPPAGTHRLACENSSAFDGNKKQGARAQGSEGARMRVRRVKEVKEVNVGRRRCSASLLPSLILLPSLLHFFAIARFTIHDPRTTVHESRSRPRRIDP